MSTVEPPALWTSGPWADAYLFREKLGEGGQGYTFHAVTSTDQTDVAVKVLRPDRDSPKARRRMLREVTTLRSLSKTDAQVPSFIESNINDAIEDSDLRPYVVMEYLPGDTLLQAQRDRGPLPLPNAIDFTNLLLDTIAIAHSEDTTHRDIKPQNIVLKGDDYATPYLIDFGLSFNSVVDHEDGLTSIRESIGNDFLRLPESELTGSELKHEFASDLTLISGILFFILTDKFPEYLSPDNAKSPHQRHSSIIESMHSETTSFLMQFFDRAFQYDVSRRFQSSDELRDRLRRLKDQSEGRLPDIDPIAVAKETRERVAAENRPYQLDSIEKQHDTSLNEFFQHVQALSNGNELAPIKLTLQKLSFGNREFNGQEVIRNSIVQMTVAIPSYYDKNIACRYFLAVDGDEIAVRFQEARANNKNEAVQLPKSLPPATCETLLSFYVWKDTHTDSLRRHFANWFDRAARELTK